MYFLVDIVCHFSKSSKFILCVNKMLKKKFRSSADILRQTPFFLVGGYGNFQKKAFAELNLKCLNICLDSCRRYKGNELSKQVSHLPPPEKECI